MSRALSAAILLSFLCALPAHADIDQHCLASCVSSGIGNTACMKQCRYNIDTTPKPVVIPEVTLESLEVHRSFPVPTPAPGANEILPKTPKPLISAEKDPVCVSGCLHQGLQYDYCSEQCVKTPCPPDTVICPKPQTRFTAPK